MSFNVKLCLCGALFFHALGTLYAPAKPNYLAFITPLLFIFQAVMIHKTDKLWAAREANLKQKEQNETRRNQPSDC